MAPTWVADAITMAKGIFVDYIAAGALQAAIIIAVFSGFQMIMKLIRNLSRGKPPGGGGGSKADYDSGDIPF